MSSYAHCFQACKNWNRHQDTFGARPVSHTGPLLQEAEETSEKATEEKAEEELSEEAEDVSEETYSEREEGPRLEEPEPETPEPEGPELDNAEARDEERLMANLDKEQKKAPEGDHGRSPVAACQSEESVHVSHFSK